MYARIITVSLLASCLLLVSCFKPEYPSGGFTCSVKRECPDDFYCAPDNRCYRNDSAPGLETGPGPDLGFDAKAPDGSVPQAKCRIDKSFAAHGPMTQFDMVLDIKGFPHLLIKQDNKRILHHWFDGTTWQYKKVDTQGDITAFAAAMETKGAVETLFLVTLEGTTAKLIMRIKLVPSLQGSVFTAGKDITSTLVPATEQAESIDLSAWSNAIRLVVTTDGSTVVIAKPNLATGFEKVCSENSASVLAEPRIAVGDKRSVLSYFDYGSTPTWIFKNVTHGAKLLECKTPKSQQLPLKSALPAAAAVAIQNGANPDIFAAYVLSGTSAAGFGPLHFDSWKFDRTQDITPGNPISSLKFQDFSVDLAVINSNPFISAIAEKKPMELAPYLLFKPIGNPWTTVEIPLNQIDPMGATRVRSRGTKVHVAFDGLNTSKSVVAYAICEMK